MEGADPESKDSTAKGTDSEPVEAQDTTARPPTATRWVLPVTILVLVGVVVGFVFFSPHPPAGASVQGQGAIALATQTPPNAATPQLEATAEQTPADTPTPLPVAARVDALAPDFTFNDVYTTTDETLWSLRGQPVWINFWATWCQPCAEEMPWMKEIYDAHKDDGLRILSMNESDGTQRIVDYIKGKDYNWTFAVDWDLETSHRYGVQGIPVHVFVDKDGVIRTLNVGEMAPGAMEEGVKSILAK